MKTIITAQCLDQTLTLTNSPKLASGGENVHQIELTFDSNWAGYGKEAVFWKDASRIFHVVMVDDTCIIPWELTAEPGRVHFSVRGVKGSVTRSSEEVILSFVQGPPLENNFPEPLPDVYKQVLSAQGENAQAIKVERSRLDNLLAAGTVEDSELIDVRVGADGTTYASAGEAVREQFNAVNDALVNSTLIASIDFEQGTLDGDTGEEADASNRIRSNIFKAAAGSTLSLSNINMRLNVYLYALGADGEYTFAKHTGMLSGPYTFESDSYARVVLKTSVDSDINSTYGMYLVRSGVYSYDLSKLETLAERVEAIEALPNIHLDYALIVPPSAPRGDCVINAVPHDITTRMSLEDIYGAYDALVESYAGYVTRTRLGSDASSTYPVYRYDFIPELPEIQSASEDDNCHNYTADNYPTVIFDACIHGSEQPCAVALLNLMALIAGAKGEDWLGWLRKHIHFVVIPVANPYGYAAYTRGNANGVDLNRNFTQGFEAGSSDTASENYRGAYALSEPEAQYINTVLAEYKGKALLYYGLHAFGVWTGFDKMTCYQASTCKTDDLLHIGIEAIKNLTYSGWENHALPENSGLIGVVQLPSKNTSGTAANQGASYGIPSAAPEVMYRYYDGETGPMYNTSVNCMNAEYVLRVLAGGVNRFLYGAREEG